MQRSPDLDPDDADVAQSTPRDYTKVLVNALVIIASVYGTGEVIDFRAAARSELVIQRVEHIVEQNQKLIKYIASCQEEDLKQQQRNQERIEDAIRGYRGKDAVK